MGDAPNQMNTHNCLVWTVQTKSNQREAMAPIRPGFCMNTMHTGDRALLGDLDAHGRCGLPTFKWI